MNSKLILVHDYAGHPFQIQLSRFLAARLEPLGYQVVHAYSASTLTPRGPLARQITDPPNFDIQPINLNATIPKYSFVKRAKMERAYGRLFIGLCNRLKPAKVLSANTPTFAQAQLIRWAGRHDTEVFTWIQDMYGVAAKKVLGSKFGTLGRFIGTALIKVDHWTYRRSTGVIPITEDFVAPLKAANVPHDKIQVVENWAPLDEVPPQARENDWTIENGVDNRTRFVYSGTLSVRHNPQLLLDLAKRLSVEGSGQLIVVSEGSAAEWLRSEGANLTTLRVLPFQPFERLSELFGAADILVAILEPDAGTFCVPSKVLSYFCAGRALLTAIPEENEAARLVRKVGAGINVAPRESSEFIAQALELLDNPNQRDAMGRNARSYAEQKFDIQQIAVMTDLKEKDFEHYHVHPTTPAKTIWTSDIIN
ncbi:MAG: glycosyltransferase family 4 protein [Planctomycetota bacterium]